MLPEHIQEDINTVFNELKGINKYWDGKECIMEMKERNFQWRQMEWWAFYFELICRDKLSKKVQIPGDSFDRVTFDIKRSINWDLKASVIKSDRHIVILNDIHATNESLRRYGYHGEIIGLFDAEYNDVNRTFQKWHSQVKEGLSKYETERIERTSVSRYRKTNVTLVELVFLVIDKDTVNYLDIFSQGRNSNGNPRNQKYSLKIENLDQFNYQLFQL